MLFPASHCSGDCIRPKAVTDVRGGHGSNWLKMIEWAHRLANPMVHMGISPQARTSPVKAGRKSRRQTSNHAIAFEDLNGVTKAMPTIIGDRYVRPAAHTVADAEPSLAPYTVDISLWSCHFANC